MYFVDRTGKRYGRLTVLKLSRKRKKSILYWSCLCSCGVEINVRSSNLQCGNTKSCGCLAVENGRKQGLAGTIHGEGAHWKRTRTYRVWQGMLRRCLTLSATGYHNYGGRGIKVCKRWRKYTNFIEDMGHCPENKMLDRINNEKGYKFSNCKWSTRKEQNRNTRRTIKLKYQGRIQCLADWARELKIPIVTFWRHIKRGQTILEIIR